MQTRSIRLAGVSQFTALVLASACTDGPFAPALRQNTHNLLTEEYECTVNVVARQTSCELIGARGHGGARLEISLGVGPIVMAGSWVHSRGSAADEDTSTATVSFTNKTYQPIGTTDGTIPAGNGNRLYYTTPPFVNSVSSGTVAGASIRLDNPDGTADFTASNMTTTWSNRPFYQYNGIIAHDAASTSRQIRYVYSSNVTGFTYYYRIMATVQHEYGWITLSTATTPVLEPGATTTLTGTVYNQVGQVQADGITWSSSNTAVATVNSSTGEVTTVGQGTATITATSTVNAQRTGTRTIVVDAAPVVLSTTPDDGDTPVAADADIMIFFSEAVNVSTSSFLLECPVGEGELAFTVSGSGTSTITLHPEADLPEQAICTVTVAASAVSDTDATDGPDVMAADYVFSFEVGITIHP
jgi:uncharacterized protein YjdB